jgi:hypothetical protein
MQAINSAIGALLDVLLWPFQAWPLAGLTVVSLLVALGLLAAFKMTSNQRALAAAKRRIQANLFELRLFQDDPRLVMRVVGDLVRQQAVYLRYAFVPLVWVALPLAVLAAHLQARYGYDGLQPGHAALVTVRMKAAVGPTSSAARPDITLDAPSGLRVETPGVWATPLRETAWRIAAERDGDYELRISSSAFAPITKRVRVTPLVVARPAIRPSPSIWDQLLMPAEAPLPADSPIEAIEITYPERAIPVLGVHFHWIVVFLLLSTLFAFVFRSVFNVVL